MIKKILTYPKLAMKFAKGICGFRKKEYELTFVYEPDDNLWYIDMPWPGDRYNLAMVAGADKLLNHISKEDYPEDKCEKKWAHVFVHPSKKPMPELLEEGYAECVQQYSSTFGGATYKVNGLPGFTREIWICPVTLAVLGNYPKYIYIKYSNHMERLLMSRLSDMNLSKRAMEATSKNGIITLKDLTNCTKRDIIKMLPTMSVNELLDLLESLNLDCKS